MVCLSTLYHLVVLVIMVNGLASCFPDGYDRCGEGFEFKKNDCYKIESDPSSNSKPNDAGTDGDSAKPDKWIGAPCTCEGDLCTIAQIPTFFLGTILGCDNVPQEWPGAVLGCMQTYVGELVINSYYAQGFCTLINEKCRGDDIICNTIPKTGDQTMTACPEGSVMVKTNYSLAISALNAVIDQTICAPACESDEDCRTDDFDEITESRGQYECIDNDGVSFCHDDRNLLDGYTAEAF